MPHQSVRGKRKAGLLLPMKIKIEMKEAAEIIAAELKRRFSTEFDVEIKAEHLGDTIAGVKIEGTPIEHKRTK